MWERYPFAAGEVCCHKTSLNFVDSVWEILGPLLGGARAVVVPDGEVRDPWRLVNTLAAEQVTRIVLVPSLLRSLLEAMPDLPARLPRLGLWFTSGEALPPELGRLFLERLPRARLGSLYGA